MNNRFFIHFLVGVLKKKDVVVTKSVRKRFHELSLGRNNRLGLGTSKIDVFAKNSKKKQGKLMIFLVFPACGVGFLTSSGGSADSVPKGSASDSWFGSRASCEGEGHFSSQDCEPRPSWSKPIRGYLRNAFCLK